MHIFMHVMPPPGCAGPSTSHLTPHAAPSHHSSNRAAARLHLKNYEGCAEDARESVRLSEGYAKGWIKLGQALHKLGRHQEGAEAYGTAERLEPDNKAAASGRAECLKALKASSSVSSGSTGSSSSSSSARAAPRAPAGGFDPSALAGLMGGAGGAGGNPMNNPMVQNMVSSAAKDPELAASMSDPDVMACVGWEEGGGPRMRMRTRKRTHSHSHSHPRHPPHCAVPWRKFRGPWLAAGGQWQPCP